MGKMPFKPLKVYSIVPLALKEEQIIKNKKIP